VALQVIAAAPDVNTRDEYGNTPLHDAAVRDPRVVRALLHKRADREAVNGRGLTPLAAAREHLERHPDLRGAAVAECIALLA
jgi:ankyrin repeat protein